MNRNENLHYDLYQNYNFSIHFDGFAVGKKNIEEVLEVGPDGGENMNFFTKQFFHILNFVNEREKKQQIFITISNHKYK